MSPFKNLVIGFGHKKFVGKDTAASYLASAYGFTQSSFAEALKMEVARTWQQTIRQWARETGRSYTDFGKFLHNLIHHDKPAFIVALLQEHGTELRRHDDIDYWVKVMDRKWRGRGCPNTVISDVRFPNEVEWIKEQGGFVVRIDRVRAYNNMYDTHTSETMLEGYKGWDFILQNNGTPQEFYQKLNNMMDSIRRTLSVTNPTST